MIRQEITLQLPPATLQSNGDILARAFPLMIAGTPEAWQVNIEDIYIAPNTGVVEVQFSGAGLDTGRRHAIGAVQTALPQAWASQMDPLRLVVSNLNPDSAVHVVIVLNVVETLGGRGSAYGGAVRFQGADPLGTDGARASDQARGTAGADVRAASGHWWHAWLTVDSVYTVRNIRDITGQVRVLAPSGTGSIPVGGETIVAIIVKKDGVTLEASTTTLDFAGMFDPSLSGAGTVIVPGIAAGTILSAMLKDGAVTAAKLASQAVTPAKLQYPAPLIETVEVTSGLGAGATLATANLVLDAGTYSLWAFAGVGAEGISDYVEGDLKINLPTATGWAQDRVRYEWGVDGAQPVIGTGSVVHAGGTLAITASFTKTSGAGTFTSRNGYLSVLAWRTA